MSISSPLKLPTFVVFNHVKTLQRSIPFVLHALYYYRLKFLEDLCLILIFAINLFLLTPLHAFFMPFVGGPICVYSNRQCNLSFLFFTVSKYFFLQSCRLSHYSTDSTSTADLDRKQRYVLQHCTHVLGIH